MIDLIIKNAHVATATDTFKCDIGIDKEKIIIWGVSSGANSALWLGLSDDMAEIGSMSDIYLPI